MFCQCDRKQWNDKWEHWVLVTKRTKVVAGATVEAKRSCVRCLKCSAVWVTTASYVDILPEGQLRIDEAAGDAS